MDQLNDLFSNVTNKVLILRSIERIVKRPQFEAIYAAATENEKQKVNKYIEDGNKEGLLDWLHNQKRKLLGELSVATLRRKASILGIPFYNKMPKSTLLSEITRREQQETIF